jgi:hypothetical protein
VRRKTGTYYFITIQLLAGLLFLAACSPKKEVKDPLFRSLNSKSTGIDFRNDLVYTKEFNLFKYMYFYNGSGLGAGDFNKDGKTDLFFGSNQGRNKLYLNQGNLKFADKTSEAAIPDDGGWTTGISVVDINNDGWLDIYVCRVGNFETLKGKNQLLINKGINKAGVPVFADEAAAYGLDFSGFSTQAAFFDYDLDGDLDMFLMNHSVHQNGTFKPRSEFINTYHPLSGDRFYRNDSGKYTDITREVGIQSSAIGYGLGIVISDVNLDGYPDIYIGNDFHENDYLYINQQNGTFKDECQDRVMHTSQFSMGVDAADINNDGWPEIVSVDMLPSDPYILKRSLGEDTWDIFNFKIGAGYAHQYTRNNLQVSQRNGHYSETGLYSGIAATDWSWAPLWMDFDNDGRKDLFISNGIPKRMNDIDYVNFVSNEEVQQKINSNSMDEKNMALISKFPEIKLPNKFFSNNGDLSFTDDETRVEGNEATYSNGAVYADFDNDGDLDIAVNNINAEALLYENQAAIAGSHSSLQLKLEGPAGNLNAIGSRVILFSGKEIKTWDKFPVRGFISSMESDLLIGLKNTRVDSLLLVWPDNSYQRIAPDTLKGVMTVQYKAGLPLYDFARIRNFYPPEGPVVTDITKETGIEFGHTENRFAEFDREPLLPHMFSTEGPALAIGDMNKDGLDDVFLGTARNGKDVIYLQQASGRFSKSVQPALEADSVYETTDAIWTDLNNDGYTDLVAVSGGNEFYGEDIHNTPRVYLNSKEGILHKKEDAFTALYLTASVVTAQDFTGDGFTDLFIGARTIPFDYGKIPSSCLLVNDGTGKFTDRTDQLAPGLKQAGFVTSAQWIDLDGDKIKDLLCTYEWGVPTAWLWQKGKMQKKELTSKKGWWNFMVPADLDNDGDIDFMAGNLGLNSRLKASVEEPVRLYVNDFDNNGKNEQVLTYFLRDKEIPFANKAELEKQMPVLKKKYLYAEDFAKAKLNELFSPDKLSSATRYTADYFSNAVFINKGRMDFEVMALPYEAQLTEMKTAVIVDANKDQLPDILLMGNYYENNIEMGRYDAGYGTLLLNKGKGIFSAEGLNGLVIKGQVRHIAPLMIQHKPAYFLALNNDTARIIQFK